MKVYSINATDEEAVRDLVMLLIQSEATEFTVYNEFEEDITDEIETLKSLKIRSMLKKK